MVALLVRLAGAEEAVPSAAEAAGPPAPRALGQRPTVCENGCRGLEDLPPVEAFEDAWVTRATGGAVGLAFAISLGAGSTDRGLGPPLRGWRTADAFVLGGGLAAVLGPRLLDKRSPDLAQGLFSDCDDGRDGLGALDRKARQLLAGGLSRAQRERASRWSDLTLAAAIAQPIGMALGASPAHRERDIFVSLGAMGVSLAVNNAVKNLLDRPRPFVHYCEPASPGELCTRDAQFSFYSGHTSTAFAAAVTSGQFARMHGYRNAKGIWISGLTLASVTGVLRMKADKHYLSDILVGAAAGSLAGWFLPKLHAPEPAAPTAVDRTSPSVVTLVVPQRSPRSSLTIEGGLAPGPSLTLTWRW